MFTFRITIEDCPQELSTMINPDNKKLILHKRSIYAHNNYLIILNKTDGESGNLVIKNQETMIDENSTETLEIPNIKNITNLFGIMGLKPRSEHEFYSLTIVKKDDIQVSIKEWPKLPVFLEIRSRHLFIISEYMNQLGINQNNGTYGSLSEFYSDKIGIPKEYINNLSKIDFTTNLFLPDAIKIIS